MLMRRLTLLMHRLALLMHRLTLLMRWLALKTLRFYSGSRLREVHP